MRFDEPDLRCTETTQITFGIMKLLIKYAYNTGFEHGYFTIGYHIHVARVCNGFDIDCRYFYPFTRCPW
jgi:hypothetical protein